MATSAEVLAYAKQLAAKYGLTITSHVRTPERNRAVGGATNSDHLTGLGIDLAGDPKQMAALAAWARSNMGAGSMFRWIGWGDAGHRDHVHLSFNAASEITQTPSTPTTATATAPASGGSAVAEMDELAPNATPQQIEEYVRKHYPQIAPFLKNDEIRKILLRPDIDELDEIEIETLLRKTTYWQTHGPESRAFDSLLGTDKQAASALIGKAKRLLADRFAKLGITATEQQLGHAAKQAIRSGWITLQGQVLDAAALDDFAGFILRQATGGEMRDGVYVDKETGRKAFFGPNGEAGTATRAEIDKHVKPGDVVKAHKMPDGRTAFYIEGKFIDENRPELTGEPAFDADQLGAIARKYGVPMTRKSLEDWAIRLLEGTASEESFRAEMTAKARGMWANDPDVLRAIDEGRTPSDFFSSHVETIAGILELDPGQIDIFGDPKFKEITQFWDGEKRRSMTLGEVTKWARGRPEFADTREYKSTEGQMGMNLTRFFGAAA